MKRKILFIVLLLVISLCLVYIFIPNFTYIYDRVKGMISSGSVKDPVESSKTFLEMWESFTSSLGNFFKSLGHAFTSWSNLWSGICNAFKAIFKFISNFLLYAVFVIQFIAIMWILIYIKTYLWKLYIIIFTIYSYFHITINISTTKC